MHILHTPLSVYVYRIGRDARIYDWVCGRQHAAPVTPTFDGQLDEALVTIQEGLSRVQDTQVTRQYLC